MKAPAIATTLSVALGIVVSTGIAHARNPHCAGGIQYVVQGMHDKDAGNLDDYKREMQKAVQQLEQCSSEDPNDFEALGYLGWAYAEVDSSRLAGETFAKAIVGLQAHDPKKATMAKNNRDSYWATAFNAGITKVNEAQAAYPDFSQPAGNDADQKLKAEATAKYQDAIVDLTRASQIKPGDSRTMRSLGSVYASMGNLDAAQATAEAGLKAAPNDSGLAVLHHQVLVQKAGQLIDAKEYDKAIAFYTDLIKSDPNNGDLYLGLAEAYFKKAQSTEGDAKKAIYKSAGDAYAKAGQLKPGASDLPFNAALAYQQAGEPALAEPQWRAALKAKPDDVDALSALGATLSDLKRYDEAVQVLHDAVMKDPKNKIFHRQLGAVYTKAGNTSKGTEEFMVYLALENGTPVSDPAGTAKGSAAASAAGKALASMGAPDQINSWQADSQSYDTWFYWTKSVAYHFSKQGALLQKSEWGTAAPAAKK